MFQLIHVVINGRSITRFDKSCLLSSFESIDNKVIYLFHLAFQRIFNFMYTFYRQLLLSYCGKLLTTSVTAKCIAFDIKGKKVDNLNE